MVLQAWRTLVTEWNLGISSDSAVAKGQELIMARLQHPTPKVQETLLALLEAKLSKPQEAWEMSEEVHTTIRLVFSQVLTREDWEAIAVSASQQVYAQVRKQELAMVDN